MKNIFKVIGLGVLMGAAYQAGSRLWDEVLAEKVSNGFNKLKRVFKES